MWEIGIRTRDVLRDMCPEATLEPTNPRGTNWATRYQLSHEVPTEQIQKYLLTGSSWPHWVYDRSCNIDNSGRSSNLYFFKCNTLNTNMSAVILDLYLVVYSRIVWQSAKRSHQAYRYSHNSSCLHCNGSTYFLLKNVKIVWI